MLKKIRNWIKFTIAYKAMISLPNKEVHFEHRIGQEPRIWTKSLGHKRGETLFGAYITDEFINTESNK